MKRPTFMEGTGVALVLSVLAAVLFSVLLLFVTAGLALRAVVSGIGFAYVVYLLVRSGERVGRVSAVAGWLLLSGATWVTALPLPLFLTLHIGGVWLIRSLYYHAGVLSALVDAGLGLLGLAAALWAAIQSNSLFLSVWCFFWCRPCSLSSPSIGVGPGRRPVPFRTTTIASSTRTGRRKPRCAGCPQFVKPAGGHEHEIHSPCIGFICIYRGTGGVLSVATGQRHHRDDRSPDGSDTRAGYPD